MPQARKKTPFSGKAKKQQIQAKKHRKNQMLLTGNNSKDDDASCNQDLNQGIKKINTQPNDNSNRNKYSLQFFQESKEELQKWKEESRNLIKPCSIEQQEISDEYFLSEINMPKRPPWDFSMSKEQLEIQEQRYFSEYLKEMESLSKISYFEVNLETWRQLWRVAEMSDILLIIVDIRFPAMMFPPYLYDYITNTLVKDMILILNKVDLAPASLVIAWQQYFKSKYPKLHILMFTSFPNYNLRENNNGTDGIKKKRKKGKMKMAAEGAQKIMETCKEIVGENVDLTSWHEKIQEEMHLEYDLDDLERPDNVIIEKKDTSYYKHERYKNGILIIGCIGTPNVGKSSLINALMGKKVVSVSRTPGHTKHFQTIFLTKNVCLCDCPGLVFPSTVPKQFQILMGSFPIAQLREPYSTIKLLAERKDLPKLLNLQHQENDDTWSAMDICESWAAKRKYYTAKAGRLDTYRAANSILRMALEGKICLYTYPPAWSIKQKYWECHPDIDFIKWIQASTCVETEKVCLTADPFSESENDEPINQKHKILENDKDENLIKEASEDESEILTVSNKFEVFSVHS